MNNILVCGNKNKDLFRVIFVRFHIIYCLSFHISVKYCLLHREFGFSYLPRHYLGLRLPLNTYWINQYRVFFSNVVVIYACAVCRCGSVFLSLLQAQKQTSALFSCILYLSLSPLSSLLTFYPKIKSYSQNFHDLSKPNLWLLFES